MMAAKHPKYEVFKGKGAAWYFRLVAGNGKIVMQSEGYPTKAHAQRGARAADKTSAYASEHAVEVVES
jgi:uncharacterized protein YegP (UPF0339 family)